VKKYLPLALLALAACTAAPPGPEKRVDIVLRNTMDRPIELRASMGIFGRRIFLAPGEVWRGWIPTDVSVGSIQIEMTDFGQIGER